MAAVQVGYAHVGRDTGRFQEPRLYAGGRARDLCNLPGGKRCSCKSNQIGRDGDGNHLLGYRDLHEEGDCRGIQEDLRYDKRSVALAVRQNRKDKLGTSWADASKCGLSETALTEAHKVLDVKYMKEVNRTLVRILHDAVFPKGVETNATSRLRSILKTKEAAKIIAGEAVGGEDLYLSQPWTMLSMQMWAKLTYRFEGLKEMIIGAFMDDLGELLSSVTGNQRKTLYEIDQEFEKMCEMLLKNFGTIKSLMPFLRSSLRQTMTRKLSKVGKDKEAGKKAEEYLTQLHDATPRMSTC